MILAYIYIKGEIKLVDHRFFPIFCIVLDNKVIKNQYIPT